MRISRALTLAAASALAGCNHDSRPDVSLDELHAMNAFTVNAYYDDMMRNAVVTQRSVYPYHFTADSAELNELGLYEVGVLARQFRDHPGRINIVRAGQPEELYRAHIQRLTDSLAASGVDTSRVTVSAGLPGGDGLPSDRVVEILLDRRRLGAADVPEKTVRPVPTIREEEGVR